jgi:four helix bundle protein
MIVILERTKLVMRNYQKLEAWKTSMQLINTVYQVTKDFPKEEDFGLTAQIKRAAISIASNIAEGMGRQYKKDTIQFLHVARGSVYELETLLNIATMIELLQFNKYQELLETIDTVVRLLNALISPQKKASLK